MNITSSQITRGLRQLGLNEGDVVLAHLSLSRFGRVEGGADAMIDALLETVGPSGTLLMSALTTRPPFIAACIRAADSGELADVRPFHPHEDAPWSGKVPNVFWKRPGVVRSLHPTHSVTAFGPLADELIHNHANAPGPCGVHTPYGRIMDMQNASILLMGVNHQSNSALHGVEEMAEVPYGLYPKWSRIPVQTETELIETRSRVHLGMVGRHLNAFETLYVDAKAERVGQIGDAVVRLVNAKAMKTISLEALEKDPWGLVSPDGRDAYEKMKTLNRFAFDRYTDLEAAIQEGGLA